MLNTFYLWLYGIGYLMTQHILFMVIWYRIFNAQHILFMVIWHRIFNDSTHFIYGYMA